MPGVAGNRTGDPLITSPTANQLSYFVPNVSVTYVVFQYHSYFISISEMHVKDYDNLTYSWLIAIDISILCCILYKKTYLIVQRDATQYLFKNILSNVIFKLLSNVSKFKTTSSIVIHKHK